jgi:hypothetical protein
LLNTKAKVKEERDTPFNKVKAAGGRGFVLQMDPEAQQAQKAPVAPKSQPSSTKQRRASQAEQPTASIWSNGDFEWPESVNPGVRFTENGWPLFEEHGGGTCVTVKTQTGFDVDVFCTKNNQTVPALYKQWEGGSCVQKAVVLSYVQESQNAFLKPRPSLTRTRWCLSRGVMTRAWQNKQSCCRYQTPQRSGRRLTMLLA